MTARCKWCGDDAFYGHTCNIDRELARRNVEALEALAKILALAVRMEGGADATDGIESRG